MALAVVLVLEEKVLVRAVSGKRYRGCAEAGQRALESVEAGKGALESPGITIQASILVRSFRLGCVASTILKGGTHALSQGSYRGWPAASLKWRMLKPVMLALPRAARSTLRCGIS